LFGDLSDLVRAQWRLTSYVITGSARILALRLGALVAVCGLGLASWAFLNVTLWRATAGMTEASFMPPLVLMALNAIAGVVLFGWQRGLKLK